MEVAAVAKVGRRSHATLNGIGVFTGCFEIEL